jgi:hypothetical protein
VRWDGPVRARAARTRPVAVGPAVPRSSSRGAVRSDCTAMRPATVIRAPATVAASLGPADESPHHPPEGRVRQGASAASRSMATAARGAEQGHPPVPDHPQPRRRRSGRALDLDRPPGRAATDLFERVTDQGDPADRLRSPEGPGHCRAEAQQQGGKAVTQLHEHLNRLGFHCGKADVSFGPRTEESVKRRPRPRRGLTADGVVGEKTWTSLPTS